MKKNSIRLTLLTISLILFTSPLFAIGMGVYVPASRSRIKWSYSDYADFDIYSDASRIGIGFILDTAVAKNNLFNYRLNLGITRMKIDHEEGFFDIEGFESQLINTFGFGIIRTEVMRLWIGPQISLGRIFGEYDLQEDKNRNKFDDVYIGTGAAAGFNLHIGERISLGLDGGYRISGHFATAYIGAEEYFVTGTEEEIFMSISAIFRINDYMY